MKLVTCIFFVSGVFHIQLTDGSDSEQTISSFRCPTNGVKCVSWNNSICESGVCKCLADYPVANIKTYTCLKGNLSTFHKCEINQQCGPELFCINNFCQTLLQPDKINLTCERTCDYKNSECIDGRCYCMKSYPAQYKQKKTCYSDGRVGAYCSFLDNPCKWPYSTCKGSECVCLTDKPFIDNDIQRCLSVPHDYSLGIKCHNVSDCDWENSVCEKRECQCDKGFTVKHYDQKFCSRPYTYGIESYCESSKECTTEYSKCINNTCVCEKSRVQYFGKCIVPTTTKSTTTTARNEYIRCDYTYQCSYKLPNSKCMAGYCLCPYDYRNKSNGICNYVPTPTVPFSTSGDIYSSCRSDSDCHPLNSHCSYQYVINSYGICQCTNETREVNGECQNRLTEGSSCYYNDECDKSLTCSNGFCRLKSDGDSLTTGQSFGLAFGVIILATLVGIGGAVLYKRRCLAVNRNDTGVIVIIPHSAGTHSTPQHLSEINSNPPSYSEVYNGSAQQPSEHELKPPIYDEALQQASWQNNGR